MRHGDVARFRGRNGASSYQPGKDEWPGVEGRQPVMEAVGPRAGDAGQTAPIGDLVV